MSKLFVIAVVVLLLAGNVFFGLQYYSAQKELEGAKITVSTQRYNEKVVNFMKMFIKKVIRSDKEVDFETRLKLENSVRELDDAAILASWQSFVTSPTESDAQKNVKDLLGLLAEKVYIK